MSTFSRNTSRLVILLTAVSVSWTMPMTGLLACGVTIIRGTAASWLISARVSSVWAKCRFISSPSKSALYGVVTLQTTSKSINKNLLWHTHTHPFNGLLSGTTQVNRYQKGKTNLDFTEARDSEWQWHPLGHMQVCTLLQTDNHASTPLHSVFYRPDALPAAQPTASKHWRQICSGKSLILPMAMTKVPPSRYTFANVSLQYVNNHKLFINHFLVKVQNQSTVHMCLTVSMVIPEWDNLWPKYTGTVVHPDPINVTCLTTNAYFP